MPQTSAPTLLPSEMGRHCSSLLFATLFQATETKSILERLRMTPSSSSSLGTLGSPALLGRGNRRRGQTKHALLGEVEKHNSTCFRVDGPAKMTALMGILRSQSLAGVGDIARHLSRGFFPSAMLCCSGYSEVLQWDIQTPMFSLSLLKPSH